MLLLIERAKAVVEPAGAAALAAILAGRVPGTGPAVAVLSGGNIDPLLLTKLIEHGLSAAGRYLTLRIVMADRVGALAALTGELARLGLNVLDVEHHRSGRDLAVSEVEVQVTVETRDPAHHAEVVDALDARPATGPNPSPDRQSPDCQLAEVQHLGRGPLPRTDRPVDGAM